MTDLLADLKTYYVENELVEKSIYRDVMPDKPDTAIALYEYQGQNAGAHIAGAVRSVQVVSRSKSADEAKLTARKLHNLLETEEGDIKLTAERWAMVSLRNPPFKLKVDESGRVYYTFNVGFTTYND